MMKRGAGYAGYSMSNNAVKAYENNERPLSRWTLALVKAYIAEQEGIEVEDFEIVGFWKSLLKKTSWHHTSSRYNRTDFYSVFYSDDDIILNESGKKRANKKLIDDISFYLNNDIEILEALRTFNIKESVVVEKENQRFCKNISADSVIISFPNNIKAIRAINSMEIYSVLANKSFIKAKIERLEEARLAKIEILEKSIANLQAKLAKLA